MQQPTDSDPNNSDRDSVIVCVVQIIDDSKVPIATGETKFASPYVANVISSWCLSEMKTIVHWVEINNEASMIFQSKDDLALFMLTAPLVELVQRGVSRYYASLW